MKTKILPVIHYADDEQAMRNAAIAFEAGCDGVFLIHMQGHNRLLLPIAGAIKTRWPDKAVGINLLGVDAMDAVTISIGAGLDMTWTDEQLTHSEYAPWAEAERVRETMSIDPEHLVFVGVAFKHQRREPLPRFAARKAMAFGFIPTTSGSATGIAADVGEVAYLRKPLGEDGQLAIASGITPENVREFAPHLTHILVATGVSSSFHEMDPHKLHDLVAACRETKTE